MLVQASICQVFAIRDKAAARIPDIVLTFIFEMFMYFSKFVGPIVTISAHTGICKAIKNCAKMKKVLIYTGVCIAFFALVGGTAASAQNQEKQLTPEEMASKETERLERALKLEDWQVFYVDSTLQHDFAALDAEMKGLQQGKVGNVDLYYEVNDKWMEQIDNSFKKWFTPEQWKKYLKSGAGKSQKDRAKRRERAAKATRNLTENKGI